MKNVLKAIAILAFGAATQASDSPSSLVNEPYKRSREFRDNPQWNEGRSGLYGKGFKRKLK